MTKEQKRFILLVLLGYILFMFILILILLRSNKVNKEFNYDDIQLLGEQNRASFSEFIDTKTNQ